MKLKEALFENAFAIFAGLAVGLVARNLGASSITACTLGFAAFISIVVLTNLLTPRIK